MLTLKRAIIIGTLAVASTILITYILSQNFLGNHPKEPPIISYSHSPYYSSVQELHEGLLDISEEYIIEHKVLERWSLDTDGIKLTKAERKNGMLGNMIKTLLDDETLLFPYYQGEPLPIGIERAYSITLESSGEFGRPWIYYIGALNGDMAIGTMYYDPTLTKKANKKGASWLLSVIDPQGLNVNNYQGETSTAVYEKELRLGDRDVIAIVIDNSKRNDGGYASLSICFVYDDILVGIMGSPEAIEAVLPHLTFREVHLPTGEPLRDTPGRAWRGE